jgi:hypothetical protein
VGRNSGMRPGAPGRARRGGPHVGSGHGHRSGSHAHAA